MVRCDLHWAWTWMMFIHSWRKIVTVKTHLSPSKTMRVMDDELCLCPAAQVWDRSQSFTLIRVPQPVHVCGWKRAQGCDGQGGTWTSWAKAKKNYIGPAKFSFVQQFIPSVAIIWSHFLYTDSGHVITLSTNDRCYTCNSFFHWLRPFSRDWSKLIRRRILILRCSLGVRTLYGWVSGRKHY